MDDWDAVATRSWGKGRRSGWWVRYVAAVAATVAGIQAVSHGFEWYASKVAGLQTTAVAKAQHTEMRDDVDTKIDKIADRIEKSIDRLGARIDHLATRRRR